MSEDLVERLREGLIEHKKRWSGDTHDDMGGSVNYDANDDLLEEAADRIEALQAERDAAVLAEREARPQQQGAGTMTETRHTPGPWRYDPDWKAIWGGKCDVEIVAPNGCQFESDSRLIAAAPDMREASPESIEMLRIAAEYIRQQDPGGIFFYDEAVCDGYCIADDCESAAETLDAAIAKAEGKDT